MKIIYLLLPAMLLTILSARAQKEYFEKAIITKNNGDTVSGYIERVRDNMLSTDITFKLAAGSKIKQVFTPEDLLGFSLLEENIKYETVRYTNENTANSLAEKRFAILLVKGYYNLYSLELKEEETETIYETDNTHLYLAKKEDSVTVLKETETMLGSSYSLDKAYQVEMQKLFSDCPAINTAMIKETGFYKKAMIKIFTAYNICKQPGMKPETYTTKAAIKTNTVVYLGYSFFTAKKTSTISGISAGFFINVLNRRVNERLALSAGFNFTKLKYEDLIPGGNVKLFGLPLKGTYYLSKRKVAPFLSFGVMPSLAKTGYTDSTGNRNNLTDWIVFGSFGPGVSIGKIYMAFLAEKEGIITFNRGTYFNLRVGYSF